MKTYNVKTKGSIKRVSADECKIEDKNLNFYTNGELVSSFSEGNWDNFEELSDDHTVVIMGDSLIV